MYCRCDRVDIATRDDHSYQASTKSEKNRKSQRSKTPSKRPLSASTVPEGDAYTHLMKKRERLLELETKMTHEVKLFEAQYWRLKTMKLLSDITGEPVDVSKIDLSPGPLLSLQLRDELQNVEPALEIPDERNVKIVCTYLRISNVYTSLQIRTMNYKRQCW
jgi:hypothetical protein